jgi:DNA-binding response OmpR family regulator
MHSPPRILIVDDSEVNRDILLTLLSKHDYELLQATDGEEALAIAYEHLPDIVLLDVMMPKIDGVEVCRRLKNDTRFPFTPIILVTSKSDSRDVVDGLEAGADEYLTKPFDQMALLARIKSVLRLKELHDRTRMQAADLANWNQTLEQRVAAQVAEIERGSRLKRFLAPQIAELVVNSGNDRMLDSHRGNVSVAFCELRGFPSFAETAAPEEALMVLGEYHECLGTLIHKFEGTLERYVGEGLIVLFNDPLPCPNHSERAVRMAIEMREAIGGLAAKWRKLGYELGFAAGIANGYATLGRIAIEGRFDYAAIGTVVNLAGRLCEEAAPGEILIDAKVHAAIEDMVDAIVPSELHLKEFQRPVLAFNVKDLRS